MLADQRLQLTDQLNGDAAPQVRLDPQLDALQPQLVQTKDLGLRE